MRQRVQCAVFGATGYSGFELVRLLARHDGAEKPLLPRNVDSAYKDLSEACPQLAGNGGFPFESFSWQRMNDAGVDVLFLATPHEFSRELVPRAVSRGFRVVDLSGAWRLQDAGHRASPGCCSTSIILALAPWIQAGYVDLAHGVICDSKSGVSGAGKSPSSKTHFVEVDGHFAAYNVFGHRHTGEILEQLGIEGGSLQFTPHLLPIARGILSTIYVKLAKPRTAEELEQSLSGFYAGKPWVRIFGSAKLPQIKFSRNTNYCDIGFSLSPDGTRAVLVSCIDNLLKGAAGQAVQNMNLMFGFDEKAGLQ